MKKILILQTRPGIGDLCIFLSAMHEIAKKNPEKIFIEVPGADGNCSCNKCPYMALNTMEKIYLALKNSDPIIHLDANLRFAAEKPLKLMLKMSGN